MWGTYPVAGPAVVVRTMKLKPAGAGVEDHQHVEAIKSTESSSILSVNSKKI